MRLMRPPERPTLLPSPRWGEGRKAKWVLSFDRRRKPFLETPRALSVEPSAVAARGCRFRVAVVIRVTLGAVLLALQSAVGKLRLRRRRMTLLAVLDALDHDLLRPLARTGVGIEEVLLGTRVRFLVADDAVDVARVIRVCGVVEASVLEPDLGKVRFGDSRAGDGQILAVLVSVAFATGPLAGEQRPHRFVHLLGDPVAAGLLDLAPLAGKREERRRTGLKESRALVVLRGTDARQFAPQSALSRRRRERQTVLDGPVDLGVEVERVAAGTVGVKLDRLHVLAGLARRQEFLFLALALRDATAGGLLLFVVIAHVLLPGLALRVGARDVRLGRLRARFRLVAVGALELDGLVVLAAVGEPGTVFAGDDVANGEGLAALRQDNALGHVILVIELQMSGIFSLLAEQLELGVVAGKGGDLRRVVEWRFRCGGSQVLVADDAIAIRCPGQREVKTVVVGMTAPAVGRHVGLLILVVNIHRRLQVTGLAVLDHAFLAGEQAETGVAGGAVVLDWLVGNCDRTVR